MLKQRIITAVVMLLLGVGFMFVLPNEYVTMLAFALLALMAWEWAGLVGLTTMKRRVNYALLTLILTYTVWKMFPALTSSFVWQVVTLTLTFQAAVFVGLFAKHGRWPTRFSLPLTFFGIVWLGNFALVFDTVFQQMGVWWLLYAMSLVWITDTGAYFAGKTFGCRKLALRVSPGKTWEGVWGGVLLASMFAMSIAVWQDMSVSIMVGLAFFVSSFSVVGDLFESALKRQIGVKDSSQMLPGHGGWLDRFDALLLALPLFFVLWQWWI
jgi:phosphatidate cytidylyltransferase